MYDTLGNVWEWVSGYADAEYYLELVRLPSSPVVDPQGPSTGIDRVIRGGGWNTAPERATTSYRVLFDPPQYRSDHVGFRVVRNPGRPSRQ
ncbi:MAG: formylglycine-generating enzyme family protein [Acidobacteriota bacterium]